MNIAHLPSALTLVSTTEELPFFLVIPTEGQPACWTTVELWTALIPVIEDTSIMEGSQDPKWGHPTRLGDQVGETPR